MVDAKCEVKVYLKESKYHCEDYCEDKICTSRVYTVVNVGCGEVKVVASEDDHINGCKKYYVVHPGEKVTLQNYKNTFYVIA